MLTPEDRNVSVWLPKWSRVDLLFAAVATAFGLVSLDYPFGRDQGLFYYAAREWLLRGQVLYRDVWDHKPPVIYFVHMLSIALFGERLWGIRVLELLVAVPILGWMTARLVSPRGERCPSGTVGAAWLGVAVMYYGYAGFWETAQCEIWATLFAIAATTVAWHARREPRGYAIAGVLSALALFTKPPMAFFVALTLLAIIVRAGRRTQGRLFSIVRGVAAFGAGGLALGGALLGYFAARRALVPMLDILVGANAVYVQEERGFNGAWEFFGYSLAELVGVQPYSGALFMAAGVATFLGIVWQQRELALRYWTPVALVAASYGTMAVQLKFYAYHWVPIVSAFGVLATLLYTDMTRVARSHPRRWLVPAAFLMLFPGMYAASGLSFVRWVYVVTETIRYETGSIDREAFTRTFDVPGMYAYHDSEQAGLWLRKHASPNDTIVVRGFEPQIYAISGRHYTGRFFWTTFLTAPKREYRREQLLAEDVAALRRHPPRYAITLDMAESGIDSPKWLESHGYAKRVTFGVFAILEHVAIHPANDAAPSPGR